MEWQQKSTSGRHNPPKMIGVKQDEQDAGGGPTLFRREHSVHAAEVHVLVHDLHHHPVTHTCTGQGAFIGNQPNCLCHIPQRATWSATTLPHEPQYSHQTHSGNAELDDFGIMLLLARR